MILEVNPEPWLVFHILPPFCVPPRPVCEAIIESLFPAGQTGRIPLATIPGGGDNVACGRWLTHLLQGLGHRVGWASAAGLYLNDRRLKPGDQTHLAGGRALLLRRSRGYVPRGVALPLDQPPVLAVGAELKNTVCLTRGDRAFMSQHIGDLKDPETLSSLEGTAAHLGRILGIEPHAVAHDLHPDYHSTRWAEEITGLPRIGVQHHHAHLAACLADNAWDVDEPVIGLSFDGTGYGTDGAIWGGEFLLGGYRSYQRRQLAADFRLMSGAPGPRRTAEGYLMVYLLDQQ